MARTDEFLNMSITEVEMWISSDELNVSAEEDVFEFILAWTEQNKVDRKKCLFTLFRHVRLVYVSRDYFETKIVTNKLVMCDKDCLDLLEELLKPHESESYPRHFLKPRKSLEVPVIVISGQGNKSLCYFPREDAWCTAPDTMPSVWCNAFTCHDQLCFVTQTIPGEGINLLRYDTFSNTSTSLSLTHVYYESQLLVASQNEIYALVVERNYVLQRSNIYSIMKHDQESNSWKHESSFEWTPRNKICIINKDDVIYFLGGKVRCRGSSTHLRDAYRYDITAKTFEKIAEMKEARSGAHGTAAHGKIFVIGGVGDSFYSCDFNRTICEVYNATTDEWQVVAGLKTPHGSSLARVVGMISVDDKLYALGEDIKRSATSHQRRRNHFLDLRTTTTIECYDPDKNEWNKKTEFHDRKVLQACSMRVFKGSEFLRKVSSPLKCHNPSQSENKNQKTLPDMEDKKKCLVM